MRVMNSIPLSVSVLPYAHEGPEKLFQIILRNENMAIELTNIGCAITAIHTPDKRNNVANIVAGFSDLRQYCNNPDYLGCVVGRFANRIANGRFRFNGTDYQLTINNGDNHLHGGIVGFGRRVWDIFETIETMDHCGIVFSYCSPDGEEGYPGNLFVTVKYLLDKNNRILINYRAVTDKSTPVNITNHSYFNLTGFKDPAILHHQLCIQAGAFTVKSDQNTSTGEIASVQGTNLDFREAKCIGENIDSFPVDRGFDHNFILKFQRDKNMIRAADLLEPCSGRSLTVYTDQPAIQLYTANFWAGTFVGSQGVAYKKHGGVALETQAWPDSPNHSHFPDAILHPGEVYETTTIFEFGVRKK